MVLAMHTRNCILDKGLPWFRDLLYSLRLAFARSWRRGLVEHVISPIHLTSSGDISGFLTSN